MHNVVCKVCDFQLFLHHSSFCFSSIFSIFFFLCKFYLNRFRHIKTSNHISPFGIKMFVCAASLIRDDGEDEEEEACARIPFGSPIIIQYFRDTLTHSHRHEGRGGQTHRSQNALVELLIFLFSPIYRRWKIVSRVLIEISSHSRARLATSENRRKDEKQKEEKNACNKMIASNRCIVCEAERTWRKMISVLILFCFFFVRSFGWVSNNNKCIQNMMEANWTNQHSNATYQFSFVRSIFIHIEQTTDVSECNVPTTVPHSISSGSNTTWSMITR